MSILFFSVLREKLGRSADVVEISRPVPAAEFIEMVISQYQAVEPYRSCLRLAVNQEYADQSTLVHPGDEVAFITPVSGG